MYIRIKEIINCLFLSFPTLGFLNYFFLRLTCIIVLLLE